MIVVVLAVLAFFLLVQSVAAIKGIDEKDGMPPTNAITVRGEGEAIATPDVATFSYTVRENNKDVAVAQKAMSDKANRAIDYLKEKGIAAKDIKTENYYTNPQYQYVQGACSGGICPPGRQVLTGYEVAQTVSVKVRDVSKAGDLLTGIAGLQIGEITSLSFTVDDKDVLRVEAKKQAIAKAKAEAEAIADALGVDLDGIVGFYEEYPHERPYPYGGTAMNESLSSVKAQDASVAPNLQTGEQKVTAIVSITYEIED